METEQAVAVLSARVARLESEVGTRLSGLEGQMAALTRAMADSGNAAGAVAAPPAPSTPPFAMPPPPTAVAMARPPATPGPVPPPPTPALVRPASSEPTFEVGVEALLRWAGLALVTLAALFLVSTAISRGWIQPELQLLGAAIIGGGLLAGALHLSSSRQPWARALALGGAVVLPVCAGAGYSWLDLYHPVVGLVLVALAVAVSVVVAIELRAEAVAVTATAAMLIVPTLARIIEDAPVVVTGTWLALAAIVAAAVGVRRRWIAYKLVSTWAVALWVSGLAASLAVGDDGAYLVHGAVLVAVVGAVLWVNPTLTERLVATTITVTPDPGPTPDPDLEPDPGSVRPFSARATEAGSPLLVPLWSWLSVLGFAALDVDEPGGWIGLAMAAGFVIVAVVAGPITGLLRQEVPVFHLLGAGALATVAAIAWLDGPTLAVVLAVQALGAVVAGVTFEERLLRFKGYGLATLPALLVIGELWPIVSQAIPDGSNTRIEVGPTLARAAVLLALAALAHQTGRSRERDLAEPIYGVVGVIAVGLIGSLAAPVFEGSAWLFIGVGCALAALAGGRRFGPFVDGVAILVGAVTLSSAVYNIAAVADDGGHLIDHLANLSVVMALVVVTVFAPRFGPIEARSPLFVTTWIVALGWVASVLVGLPQGQVLVSVAWAVAACGALVVGIRTGETIVRTVGLVTLVVVLAKLLTVDLAAVDTLWRVGLFLAVGLGMLRLGYVLPTLARRYGQGADYVEAQ